MALMNDYISNGKVKITGTTDCASCKVNGNVVEINDKAIPNDTLSTKLTSSIQVAGLISSLKGEHIPAGLYAGSINLSISVNGENYPIDGLAKINVGKNNNLALTIEERGSIKIAGVYYNSSNSSFAIETMSDYDPGNNNLINIGILNLGNLTGTFSSSGTPSSLTNIYCNGKLNDITTISNNGSITLSKVTGLVTSNCNDSTTVLRATFKRRTMNSSYNWVVDTNGNGLNSTSTAFSGTGALQVTGDSSTNVALNLKNDLPGISCQNITFMVYNPSVNDIPLRIWYYRGTGFSNNVELNGVIAKAGQWTLCTNKLTSSTTIYNVQIADFSKSGVNLIYDDFYIW